MAGDASGDIALLIAVGVFENQTLRIGLIKIAFFGLSKNDVAIIATVGDGFAFFLIDNVPVMAACAA